MLSKDQAAFTILLQGLTTDGELTEGAKDVLKHELVSMSSEVVTLTAQAERYAIVTEKNLYLKAYKDLTRYLSEAVQSTSTVGVDEFTQYMRSYYDAKEALLHQVLLTMQVILDKHEAVISGLGSKAAPVKDSGDTLKLKRELSSAQRALEKQLSLQLGGITKNLSGLTGQIDLQFAQMIEKYEQDIYNLGEELRESIKNIEVNPTTFVEADLSGYYTKQEVTQLFNTLRFEEFKQSLFDSDGYFTGKIRPLSVETTSLSVGADSTDFTLTTKFKPNYLANANNINWDAGFLTHFKVTNNTTFRWTLPAGSLTGLNPNSLYYIYARCHRTSNEGTIVFDTQQRMAMSHPQYYYFKIGTLSSVILGVRGITLSYGRTEINGREITTGKIQSISGETYFDLDLGEISGVIKFIPAGGGTPKLVSDLSLDLAEVKNYVDDVLPLELSDLQNQIDGNITSWFYPYAPTLANEPALSWNTTTLKDTHLGDLFYNTADGKAYRFQLVSGTYSWQMLSDTDISLALANAAAAQDTADGKRRVFVTTPTTPYDQGDLWSQGASGDLMRCQTSRATGAYNSADWVLASKYTDDTTANLAISNHSTLVAALKAMAYEDVVGLAKLDTTVIDGGFLKTTLLDAAYIKASIINATYIQTLDLIANKITSGKLQSVDGFNYFDLTNNQFKVGNATNYMDWNVTTANALTIKGNVIATSGSIGGYTISGTQLQATAGGSTVTLEAAGVRPYINFTDGTKTTKLDSDGITSNYATIKHLNVGGATSATDTESAMFLNAKYIFSRHAWNASGDPIYGGRTGAYTADANVFYTQTANGPELVVYKLRAANVIDAQGYTVNGVPLDAATIDVYTKTESDGRYPSKTGSGASGTWGINISGDAARASLLVGLGSYVWNASTPATSYSLGITNSFVSHVEGFPGYGSLMNMKTYDGGSAGGTLQLFTPYGNSFPSLNLRYRLSDYNTGTWSGWKILANTEDLASYLPLTGGTLSSWLQVNSYLATTGHIHSGGRVYVDGGTSYYITSGTSILNGLYLAGSLTYNSNIFNNSTPAHTDNPAMSIKLYDEYSSGTAPSTYGTVLDIHGRNGHNHTQVFFGSSGTDIYVRNAFYGSTAWNGWKRLINSDNIGAYAPSLTGTGASGTWNIGISGTSANSSQLNYWPYTSYAYRNGGTGYYQVNDWIQLNTTAGIFWPSYYGAHITVNTASSYTQLQIIGSKGSYGGIYDSYSGVNIGMYDSAGNGGIYREANDRWILYHAIGNDCLGIGTSTTYAGYKMYIGGALRVGSSTYSETSISAGTYINAGSSIAANTTINAGESMTAPNFYASSDGWFRNTGKSGLYNSTYSGHFNQDSINYWSINGGTSAPMGLMFRSTHSGSGGTTYGYVYADGANFGLLHGGSWSVQGFSGGGTLHGSWNTTGALYAGSTSGSSGTYMSPGNGVIIGNYATSPWPGIHSLYVQGIYHVPASSYFVCGSSGYRFNSTGDAYNNVIMYDNGNMWVRAGISAGSNIATAGNFYVSNYGDGLIGVYDSYKYQGIFAMGSAYTLPSGGGTPGTLYGLAWTHSNVGGQSKSGLSHQLLVMENGVTKVALGSGIWTGYNIYAAGYIQAASTGYFGGDVIAYYSDARLKTIKGNITNALAMLHQVSGVYYEANDHAISIGAVKEKKNEVGLIAQQWAGIMPEVLALAPFDMDGHGGSKSGMNYMTMKYERTVPVIIEAIKEVDNKYTREIAVLKNEMSFLQMRVAELERRLN